MALRIASSARYRHPCLRAARHARVVRHIARTVVPVAWSIVGAVIRVDGREPEPAVEVVALEMVPLETIVHASTGMTAPETVTANACRLAGRGVCKRDRQCDC